MTLFFGFCFFLYLHTYVCGVTMSVYRQWASSKICLATVITFGMLAQCSTNWATRRDAGTRKGPGGADFVEGHRQNFNYVKIHTLEFRGSAAFFLRQILTDHILSIATVITLDISTSQISSIDSATAGFIITKGTLKTYCYIIFFILKGHFCPPCPSQQKARGAAAPPAPPPSSGVPGYSVESVRVTRYSIQTDRELGKHCVTNVGHCKQIVAPELISAMLKEQTCIISSPA